MGVLFFEGVEMFHQVLLECASGSKEDGREDIGAYIAFIQHRSQGVTILRKGKLILLGVSVVCHQCVPVSHSTDMVYE